jgi:hypothetical protein
MMDSSIPLRALADHAKPDPTFDPIKDPGTTRWHARVGVREYELLLTGPKFFDTRAGKGGGGAVDLAMHLLRLDFKSAVATLRRALKVDARG